MIEDNRREIMKEIERIHREQESLENLRDALVPVDCATGVGIVKGTGEINFRRAEMSVAVPRARIPAWASHERLIFIRASGKSMQPDLSDGQMILLDQSKTGPHSGQLFLMHSASGFTMRRLLQTKGPWLVLSVEGSTPERMLAPGDRLIGAVIWAGKRNPLWSASEIKVI